MELEPRYCGIILTELITPEILSKVSMSPIDAPKKIEELRKSTTGYSLIFSRDPIVGVLIVDPVIELQKPEWNSEEV